ncbi:MAG: heme-copper oxidase subunit III [Verrucomicrobia bacterium]|nr:heme-copper oxidase subunit III [Verrucomicrobiota bacterium]
MEIPYTITERPDTGLWNAKLGIWLFLASEVMLFGGLFSAYVFLRMGAATWPHGLLNVPLATLNTAVLITSSIMMLMAWASVKFRDIHGFRFYMGLTVLLGATFLGIKGFEYRGKFTHYEVILKDGSVVAGHLENAADIRDEGKDSMMLIPDAKEGHHTETMKIEKSNIERLTNFGPWHSPFFAIYFALTGMHLLHVLGGTVVNAYFWGPGSVMFKTEPEHFANRIEVSGLFWHFVDLVWLFLFPVLYLL